jgi:lysozyme
MYDLTDATDMIKAFESCALTAYKDMVGVWTIGWGHTGDVQEGDSITQEEADGLMVSDIKRVAEGVMNLITVDVTKNQFNALVDFAYNLGLGALKRSTLLKWLNGREHVDDIAEQFLRWDFADGKEVAGLERRREAERKLFLS